MTSNTNPSPIICHNTIRREEPTAMRNPISDRRLLMRSQKVPIIPRKILVRKKIEKPIRKRSGLYTHSSTAPRENR